MRAGTSSTRSSALVGHDPNEVYAVGAGADVQVTLRYPDGSVGSISYLTGGSARFPKETLDVSGGGRTVRLDNFQRVTAWTPQGRRGRRTLAGQDKGQRAQLERFVAALRTGAPMPIPLDSLVSHDQGHDRGRDQPGHPAPGGAVSAPSAGWYLRRMRRMSAAELGHRLGDAARRQAWARRQVLPDAVPVLPPDLLPGRQFGSPLPAAARDGGPGRGGRGRRCRGRPGAGRDLERARRVRDPTAPTRTGSPTR